MDTSSVSIRKQRRDLLLGASAAACASLLPNFTRAAAFTVVAEGLQAPEAPKPQTDGSILVCEMARGTLSRVTKGNIEVIAELGGAPNGVAIGPDGAAYVCNNGGFKFARQGALIMPSGPLDKPGIASLQRVDLRTGQHRDLYLKLGDQPLRAPNDLVFDHSGGFWFTDPGAVVAGQAQSGSINWAKADGSQIKFVCGLPQVNGIALSANGKTLFVATTRSPQIHAFTIVAPGELLKDAKGTAISRIHAHGMDNTGFDSLALDSQGYLAVGTLNFADTGTGCITVIAPDGRSERVDFPEKFVTSIGFGGKDRRTAFITLTTSGKLVSMEWPRAGLALN
ncbi:MAG: SMP-30/gluconolactonase/LRE family protein [Steroidobacteraceae bacterium]